MGMGSKRRRGVSRGLAGEERKTALREIFYDLRPHKASLIRFVEWANGSLSQRTFDILAYLASILFVFPRLCKNCIDTVHFCATFASCHFANSRLEAIQRCSAICRVWPWTLTYQKFHLCICSHGQDLYSHQKLNTYIYWFLSESSYRRRRWRRRRQQRWTPQYNH